MPAIQPFLELTDEIKENKVNYLSIHPIVSFLDAFGHMGNQSFYVMDLYKREFLYVSPNTSFLGGYPACQIKEWGFDYFEKVISPDELSMISELNKKGIELFHTLPLEHRAYFLISYHLTIKGKNGEMALYSHRFMPFYLNSEGNIWLAICWVTPSVNQCQANISVQLPQKPARYIYSFKSKKFKPHETARLSERENQVLKLTIAGNTSESIALKLFVDINTVKFHKKNICRKLDVKNMTQAIYFVATNSVY